MQKVKIIYNPNAGKIKGVLSKVIDTLKKNNIRYELSKTNFPGEAKFLAEQSAKDTNTDILLTIGGDGTVNEVINGLVNSSIPLGIIPAGSLNCIAREIKLSIKPEKALGQLLNGEVKTIPLGKITFQASNFKPQTSSLLQNTERYFLLMAGIGIDAAAVFHFNPKLKKIIGPLAYVHSGLTQLFKKTHPPIEIETEKNKIIGYSCIINKMRTYAWFDFAPETGIEKEFFQMFIYKKKDILSLFRYSIGSMFGWHKNISSIQSILTKKIQLKSDKTVYVQTDGEAVGKLPAEISIVPNALKIILPKIN